MFLSVTSSVQNCGLKHPRILHHVFVGFCLPAEGRGLWGRDRIHSDVIRDGCPTGSQDISKFHPCLVLCSCSCSCPQMIRLDDAVMIALVRSSPPTSRTRLLPHGSSHAPTYRSIRAFHKDNDLCRTDHTTMKLLKCHGCQKGYHL
jgi:hypothetical protein